jgi:hypothetical protein
MAIFCFRCYGVRLRGSKTVVVNSRILDFPLISDVLPALVDVAVGPIRVAEFWIVGNGSGRMLGGSQVNGYAFGGRYTAFFRAG